MAITDEHSRDETPENEDEDILVEAKKRLALIEEAERDIRRLALDDLKFRAGEQWPEAVIAERQRDGRPCLVINKIPQFINQITNDQRQNRPSIKVHPVDDFGDVETAKIIQGLIRHIEYNSGADVAYDRAFEGAVIGGRGFFRIVTQYVDEMSFDQEILIKSIRNPFSVFFDPYSTEPDGSDANFAFITEDLSPEEYKARFPGSEMASKDAWAAVGNNAPGWVGSDTCRVAEYFCKKMEPKQICLLSDGRVVEKDAIESGLPPGLVVVREREAMVPVVKWFKMNAAEILDRGEWIGKYIPIVPVYGAELDVDGVRILEGIVRHAKDPARMVNYWTSAETEAIALAPRAPFIAAEGQLEGYQADWDSANRRNHSVLKYKPTSLNGQPVPPPQRNSFEPAVGAISQARMLAADDVKSVTGIYDASLGNRSNETSGVAIQRRNNQAQTSNFHFVDNLTRSLRHGGRIIVDLLPKIYDTARAARIIGENDEQKVVKINQPFEEDGKEVLYKLDTGKYDVTIDVGPSYATKRQESVASMLEMTRAYPALFQVAGDLLARNMDWPNAQELAERLKKTLPPGLADDKKGQQEIPPQIQAQMQQMGQMVEQLTEKLKEAQEVQEQKLLELESKERIEFKKLEVQLEIERAKLDAKDSLALLNAEIAGIESRLSMLGVNEPIEREESEEYAHQPVGAMGAEYGSEGMNPTGGESPGSLLEGNANESNEQY